MKKINLFLVALVGTLALTLTSCDDCKDVTCENGGTCVEGTCDCPEGFSGDACELEDKCVTNAVTCNNGGTCDDGTCDCADNYFGESCDDFCENGTYASGSCTCDAGYEGDDCETESRTNWIGNFNGSDNCGFTYESTISNGTAVAEINISNFGGFDATVIGTITAATTLEIKQQTDATGRVFTGTGNLASTGNSVTINYTVTYSDNTTESCVITYTRK